MAKIILRNSFLLTYKATTEYSYNNFGLLCVNRFDEALHQIINRLGKHPLSSPREPLLRNYPRSYRSAIIMGNWKIIYRYDETYNRVIFVDLWDMRMNPNRLVKQFKKKL